MMQKIKHQVPWFINKIEHIGYGTRTHHVCLANASKEKQLKKMLKSKNSSEIHTVVQKHCSGC